MARPHHRPRLDVRVTDPPEAVRAAFDARLAAGLPHVRGTSGRRHLFVEIDGPTRHLFSPTLDVVLRDLEHGGTRILGRFGPSPALWTATMFVHGGAAFVVFAGLSGALAQRVSGEPPTLLVAVAVAAAVSLATFAASRLGAARGHDQMVWLARVVDGLGTPVRDEAQVLGEAVHPATE